MLALRSLRRTPGRLWPAAAQRAYSSPAKDTGGGVAKTKEAAATSVTETHDAAALTETPADAAAAMRTMQAPNRKDIWTRSQQPREKAMTGPRFEQMVIEDQVRPPGHVPQLRLTAMRSQDRTQPSS
jgi:NADH dehydrogenase (ubiquinone) Fe-S protein 6